MITQKTAELIWNAYREIQAGEKLLKDMEEARKVNTDIDRTEKTLKDAFGHRRHLQLGIPCGENGHRLFTVSPILGESVIRAHIAEKTKELAEANEIARLEVTPF